VVQRHGATASAGRIALRSRRRGAQQAHRVPCNSLAGERGDAAHSGQCRRTAATDRGASDRAIIGLATAVAFGHAAHHGPIADQPAGDRARGIFYVTHLRRLPRPVEDLTIGQAAAKYVARGWTVWPNAYA